MISMQFKARGITEFLKGVTMRAGSLQSFLNKNVVKQYQNIQRKRWMTENKSETGQGDSAIHEWQPLTVEYAKAKKRRFASYAGKGEKLLIATGKLQKSVIGPGDGFRKIATPRSLIISTSVEYAPYVDEARSFSSYGRKSVAEINRMIKDFVFKNIMRAHTNA